MSRLDDLYKKYIGQDIYIIGTGPSLSLFPKSFLDNKLTIGLNQAYKVIPNLKYSLTIHPYLVPLDSKTWDCLWITKIKENDESWSDHLKRGNVNQFHIFHKNKNPLDFSYLSPAKRPKNGLYVGCGIQTGGIHLACLMGAKTIYLVGCDFGSINNNHHCHDQHIEHHQYSIEDVYKEYYYYTIKVKELVEQYYNVTILNLSSILGTPHYAELEFKRKNINLPKPQIIEKQKRLTPLTSHYID